MKIMITYIIIMFLFLAFCIFLQIYLSRRKSYWPGLILPLLNVLLSLPIVFSIVGMNGTLPKLSAVLFGLFYGNIPTLVLLFIYWICRLSFKKKDLLKKMSIQDLE